MVHKSSFGHPRKQYGPSVPDPALYGAVKKPWQPPHLRRIEPPADTDFSPGNEG